MTKWIRAVAAMFGVVPLVYPLAFDSSAVVAWLAAAGVLALAITVAAPRRIGPWAWVGIVVVEYGVALALGHDGIESGALILAPVMLIVLECLDLLALLDAGTVCTRDFLFARARHLTKVILAGVGAGAVVVLAGGIDLGSNPLLMVVAVAAAVGVLGASVRGWTRTAGHFNP